MTTIAHGFHMDKGRKSKLLISKMKNIVVICDNHLTSLAHMCLLFMLMQGLIIGNMLIDIIL